MGNTELLFVGALSGMVFFLTGRSIILERRLSRTGGEIKSLKDRIRRLEDEKRALESRLSESRQPQKNVQQHDGPLPLARAMRSAKKSLKLCVPELTRETAGMLPKKIDTTVLAGKIGDVGRIGFRCATNPDIDVSIAIIDDKRAYKADRGKAMRLPDAKKTLEGFNVLWKSSKVIQC